MSAFSKGNQRIVEFIGECTLDDMPVEVRDQARVCLLDLIGACLAGSRSKGASILAGFAREQMAGKPEATVIGTDWKTSCVSAALINGFTANALDIDDGHRICKGHPGAVIFPALLAAAERVQADGTAILEALAIGYETAIRAASICFGHYGYYHGSGTWGALGAAAACARLLGLNIEQTENALGIAEGYAPLAPVMRSVVRPAMAPKDGVAWGAMVGMSAALLAEEGYTGSPSLFGDPEHNDDVDTLGSVWRIMHLYFKPYPCCRWAQPSIDAVLELMNTSGIAHHEIQRIIIHTFAESAALSPDMPVDIESAEYNIRYPAAAAAVHGDFTPELLDDEHFRDETVRKIADLIETKVDPDIQCEFPEKCQSRIEIRTADGRVLDSGLKTARGDWNIIPLSKEELEVKFLNITRPVLGPDEAQGLVHLVRDMENHRVSDLIPYLVRPAGSMSQPLREK